MEKIIFATGNEGKMREIREILKDLDMPILSMKDAGIHVDIVEDGDTFEENAVIKARTIMQLTGQLVLADDSGLEVDYLNKEPGVYSARYAGEHTSYHIKNRMIVAVSYTHLDVYKRQPVTGKSRDFCSTSGSAVRNASVLLAQYRNKNKKMKKYGYCLRRHSIIKTSMG